MEIPGTNSSKPFHILSLSGGGYLGLYTAIILADLERRLGQPVAKSFDLIAGTSIGGLLALALGLEVPADRLVHYLRENGTEIFSNRPRPKSVLARRLDLLRFLATPKYRTAALERALDEIYEGNPVMGDIPNHRVIIPAVNLTKGAAQILRTPHHVNHVRDWQNPVRNVALATSAAPTYFPMARIDDELFADGGLFAQSPDLVAIHEAEHYLGVKNESIRLLSIGTTTSKFSMPPSAGRNFGLVNWALNQRLWSAMISTQQQITAYMTEYMLGDHYFRIDAIQSEEQAAELALDVATPQAQGIISGMAQQAIEHHSSKLDLFAGHQASDAVFYYGANAGAR